MQTIDPMNPMHKTTTGTVSDITEEPSVTSGYHLIRSTTSRATVRPALKYSMYEDHTDVRLASRYQIPPERLLRRLKRKKRK